MSDPDPGDRETFDPAAAAEVLLDMRRAQRIEPDLPAAMRPRDLAEAYQIQDRVVDGLLGPGRAPIGYKVACTSDIAQRALRVGRPLFGRLLPTSSSPDGATLHTADFVHRVVEAEFAFRIGTDVPSGEHTIESISEFIDAVIPAIEIVDYRYESWMIGSLQVAADNAIHGWWVHGEPNPGWRDVDLASAAVTVERNDEVVTTGSGAAVLGHPLAVMAWLATELPQFGKELVAGDVVTTGVTTDVFEAAAGDAIVASFDGVGQVAVRFD